MITVGWNYAIFGSFTEGEARQIRDDIILKEELELDALLNDPIFLFIDSCKKKFRTIFNRDNK
jgi:hypothetical protein